MTDSSTQGHTRISLRTMERIVTAAIASVPGTKAIEAKLAGIGGRGFPRVSVQMDSEREVAAVNATIGVVWPSPVTTVAEHTRAAISEAIEDAIGAELLDEDVDEPCDTILLWFRDGDGDVTGAIGLSAAREILAIKAELAGHR